MSDDFPQDDAAPNASRPESRSDRISDAEFERALATISAKPKGFLIRLGLALLVGLLAAALLGRWLTHDTVGSSVADGFEFITGGDVSKPEESR